MYSKQVTTRLKNIILFSRDIEKTSSFFAEGLGLKVKYQSKQLVELRDSQNMRILLKQVKSEAFCTTGYNPLLNFKVDDLDFSVDKLKNYGAVLDGDVLNEDKKKIACLKGPDGHMIGLVEYVGAQETDDEDDFDAPDQTGETEDYNMKEIKNILRKIKI